MAFNFKDMIKKTKNEEVKEDDVLLTNEDLKKRKRATILTAVIFVTFVFFIGSIVYGIMDIVKTFKSANNQKRTTLINKLPKDKILIEKDLEKQWRKMIEKDVDENKKELRDVKEAVKSNQKEIIDLKNKIDKTLTKEEFRKQKEADMEKIENMINGLKEVIDAKIIRRSDYLKQSIIKEVKKQGVKIDEKNITSNGQEGEKHIETPKQDDGYHPLIKHGYYEDEKKVLPNGKTAKNSPIQITRVTFSNRGQTPEQKNKINRDDLLYIPMGFTTGVTLTGMDAPTFGWGQQDPQPITISVETDMITAGGKRINLYECMVLGSGAGSVSSERALVRLVKMECRDADGNLYTGNVEGWAVGDDGKIGLKGRLVTRQGTVLAKAFMAGLLDGIGEILKTSSSTLENTALGTTKTTIKPEDATKAAIGGGLSESANKLQDFYIKIAEQIYPVVEILPGRRVTVVFKGDAVLRKVKDEDIIDLASLNDSGQATSTQPVKYKK